MIDAKLMPPSASFHASWLASWDEWGTLDQDGSAAFVAARYNLDLRQRSDFSEWINLLHHMPLEEFQPPEGLVNQSTIWVVEGSSYLGSASLRHSLANEYLTEVGGNIGYGIRPSARGRGLAKLALNGALEEARALGMERVMVTCKQPNTASARTIEACGGVLESVRPPESFSPDLGVTEPIRRYWIDLPLLGKRIPGIL
ncbi:putative acetyltransferase [Paenarthrobacter nicotinovorans]|uniref:GNAT family N-acetyltransferase n=1 Tax=Micrococcaceae TaxID=1268 RepID=UPI0008762E2A|nr:MULTISPECIES: GNAT family N-acetyltransferase [Micrococcaceae]MDR6438570.1 putative acetyltransferase [Paenarthrobacter nicotinovorans]SCZ59859.1 Predicted acetyltransferase [Arthrobacter sp. UNCCL28]